MSEHEFGGPEVPDFSDDATETTNKETAMESIDPSAEGHGVDRAKPLERSLDQIGQERVAKILEAGRGMFAGVRERISSAAGSLKDSFLRAFFVAAGGAEVGAVKAAEGAVLAKDVAVAKGIAAKDATVAAGSAAKERVVSAGTMAVDAAYAKAVSAAETALGQIDLAKDKAAQAAKTVRTGAQTAAAVGAAGVAVGAAGVIGAGIGLGLAAEAGARKAGEARDFIAGKASDARDAVSAKTGEARDALTGMAQAGAEKVRTAAELTALAATLGLAIGREGLTQGGEFIGRKVAEGREALAERGAEIVGTMERKALDLGVAAMTRWEALKARVSATRDGFRAFVNENRLVRASEISRVNAETRDEVAALRAQIETLTAMLAAKAEASESAGA